jgi:hypothetical protein
MDMGDDKEKTWVHLAVALIAFLLGMAAAELGRTQGARGPDGPSAPHPRSLGP